jgi:hypothetical protein
MWLETALLIILINQSIATTGLFSDALIVDRDGRLLEKNNII